MTATGFILINKPKNISSFACVARVRALVGGKVGHAGTLDNFATGLLILALGRAATRELDAFINLDKAYAVRAKLGQLTDTLDYTGVTIKECDASHITYEQLAQALQSFPKAYTQTPPVYSALKHNGKPLYHLARYGTLSAHDLQLIAERKKRTVHIHELELSDSDLPFFDFCARVSKGTYVRSLANDIATLLGTSATTYELERTAIGPFSLRDAVSLAALQVPDDVVQELISVESMLRAKSLVHA